MNSHAWLIGWVESLAGCDLTGSRVTGKGHPFKVRHNQGPVTVTVGHTCLGGGGFAVVYEGTFKGRPVALRFEMENLASPAWHERQRLVLQIADLVRRDPIVQAATVITHETFRCEVIVPPSQGERPFKFAVWIDVMDRYAPLEMTGPTRADTVAHPLGYEEAVRRIIPLLRASQRVWEELRIVHRDIDPLNILVDRQGGLRFTDWGIASLVQDDRSQTQTRPMGKTWEYNAPELAFNPPRTGPFTDAWSLGVLLLELATGKRPIVRPGHEIQIRKTTTEPLPAAFHRAVSGLLQVEPDKRWTPQQALDRLQRSEREVPLRGDHTSIASPLTSARPVANRADISTLFEAWAENAESKPAAPPAHSKIRTAPAPLVATAKAATRPALYLTGAIVALLASLLLPIPANSDERTWVQDIDDQFAVRTWAQSQRLGLGQYQFERKGNRLLVGVDLTSIDADEDGSTLPSQLTVSCDRPTGIYLLVSNESAASGRDIVLPSLSATLNVPTCPSSQTNSTSWSTIKLQPSDGWRESADGAHSLVFDIYDLSGSGPADDSVFEDEIVGLVILDDHGNFLTSFGHSERLGTKLRSLLSNADWSL